MTIRHFRSLFIAVMFISTALLSLFITNFAEANEKHDEHSDEPIDAHTDHSDDEKGPHGGKLLSSDNATVELLFLEQGNTSAFQAWITNNGTPANDQTTQLIVELTRLDGQVRVVNFTQSKGEWLGTEAIKAPHSFDVNVKVTTSDDDYQWTFSRYEGRVEIPAEIAIKAGIKSEHAGAGYVKQTTTAYGKVIVAPSNVSHLRARYPGTITKIFGNLGDEVTAGDIVAEVESNESLKRYTLTSPLTGTITNRDGNAGEQAQQQALLTITNYDETWVEFKVFPSQAQHVSVGQQVMISSGVLRTESVISSVLPSDSGQPFLRARVVLDNQNRQWAPGLLLEGNVVTNKIQVPLVVYNEALQRVNEQDVVFIQAGTSYEARPLTLGISDGIVTQVLGGINAGDKYVVENSYLIKADLEKSSASHQH